MKKTPILITGSHRSGSTWVGKMVARRPDMHYVHEPFNLDIERKDCPVRHWFEYIDPNSDEDRLNEMESYLRDFMKPGFKDQAKSFLRIRSLGDFGLFTSQFLGMRKRRTVYKDPIGLLASEFFYERINCDVVVIIRHPAAFAASIKMKNWRHDFQGYLDQPALMDKYLSKLRPDYEAAVAEKVDIIDVAILQWKTLYGTVKQFKEKYGDKWFFVKHENLSIKPLEIYEEMFKFLDIPYDEAAKKAIINSTTASTSSRLKRDSAANVKSWKDRLTPEEIERVRKGVEGYWESFYSEADW